MCAKFFQISSNFFQIFVQNLFQNFNICSKSSFKITFKIINIPGRFPGLTDYIFFQRILKFNYLFLKFLQLAPGFLKVNNCVWPSGTANWIFCFEQNHNNENISTILGVSGLTLSHRVGNYSLPTRFAYYQFSGKSGFVIKKS